MPEERKRAEMINREKRKKRRIQTDEAIHIVALWNLMLILIPFLLLSAAFSETSILNLMIPSSSAAIPVPPSPGEKVREPILLTVTSRGFNLGQGALPARFIPFKSDRYDFEALSAYLQELKKANPGEDHLTLSSSPQVPYEIIVETMDRCREAQFPNISLGGEAPPEDTPERTSR